jgi:hypothetical protein
MGEWFSFLSKSTMIPLATLAVFEGVRRISLRRAAWEYVAFLIFGVAVLGGTAGTLLWGASAIESTLAIAVDQKPLPSVPDVAFAQMTPQEREEKTRLLAKIAFEKSGTLATYISASGQHIRYAPSEEEIRDHEFLRESVARTRTILEFIRAQVWMLMIAGVVAAVAGVYARVYRRSEYQNRPNE